MTKKTTENPGDAIKAITGRKVHRLDGFGFTVECEPEDKAGREELRRLYEAAPDLLAALRAGVENEISMVAWLTVARAAIAKATEQGGR